jgi:hypothetical protein
LRSAREWTLLLGGIHLLVHRIGLLKAGGRTTEGVLLIIALLLLSTTFEVWLKTHDAAGNCASKLWV